MTKNKVRDLILEEDVPRTNRIGFIQAAEDVLINIQRAIERGSQISGDSIYQVHQQLKIIYEIE